MMKRRQTREVYVGNVGVGGNNPVRIQSMTTSDTRDVAATIEQVMRLSDQGCEIVRVTVQGVKEALACELIKNGLLQKGYNIPLVADIHFFPKAAFQAIEFVDKVRINPGNFVDKRASFKVIEYDDAIYANELLRIEEKFAPLVEKCKSLNKPIRIGTNHGSLSDRIMNRYGDTPAGMVESAFEFARICRKYDFHDIIFSMKASNPLVMIEAYRLLVSEMDKLNWDYPLHLGVTEAGSGEDGRVKSAVGIGSLLLDGLGDTIRVSLTEDPWLEIDPCRRLVTLAEEKIISEGWCVYKHQERIVTPSNSFSIHPKGAVILQPKLGEDLDSILDHNEPLTKIDALVGCNYKETPNINPTPLHLAQFQVNDPEVILVEDDKWEALSKFKPSLILVDFKSDRVATCRRFFAWLKKKQINTPVILSFSYDCSTEDLPIFAAAECGSLLCDGLGEGIWLRGPYQTSLLRNLSFNILQSTRRRIIKTDFISCPSCGRTLFDLQEVTKRIQERTDHLAGVKIAIMGCIVNGPGEMADADFGYVGSRPGMIDLYLGKKCVEKNIPFAQADDRLVALIKSNGKWLEPKGGETE
ncbi:MAG: (E)-4-hydroxy-3-methylbut-2-enyl-diphosphate synthase [Waddliaceae bacterium]